MEILGIDFETQGSDAKTTNITEVGASLWGKDGTNVFKKVQGYSQLCFENDYPAQTKAIVELTGITDHDLVKRGIDRRTALVDGLFPLMERATHIFAHKKAFDETVLNSTCAKLGITPPKKTWICTLTEVDWPKKFTCHKLSHLAYEHSILVDPATLHRAENDCDLMMRLITEKYDIAEIIAYANEPWVYMKAEILGPWQDGGVQSGIAKSLGFSFERCKGTEEPVWAKKWVARFKKRKVRGVIDAVIASASPFRLSVIEGIS